MVHHPRRPPHHPLNRHRQRVKQRHAAVPWMHRTLVDILTAGTLQPFHHVIQIHFTKLAFVEGETLGTERLLGVEGVELVGGAFEGLSALLLFTRPILPHAHTR